MRALPAPMLLTLRVLGAVGGGYALTSLAVTAAAAVLAAAGMARPDAVALAAMCGYLLYLVLLLWGFAVRSVARLWVALAAAATVLAALPPMLSA